MTIARPKRGSASSFFACMADGIGGESQCVRGNSNSTGHKNQIIAFDSLLTQICETGVPQLGSDSTSSVLDEMLLTTECVSLQFVCALKTKYNLVASTTRSHSLCCVVGPFSVRVRWRRRATIGDGLCEAHAARPLAVTN